ncbi:MAG: uroporphyrinogen decarboxylase family protein [Clostridia bacterium]
MNGKELFQAMAKGEKPSRIPFVPTIFEHSAKIISATPSMIAQDEDLLVKSQLACYELYGHDLISVGVDIYNLEYEAMGARVFFPDNEELPFTVDVLVQKPEDLEKLCIPDPEKDGRMPMFLRAVERINKEIGGHVPVNGTVVGPFTLAAILRGFENFIMDIIYEPEFADALMDFARKVGLRFAEGFIRRGVGLSINESWIAPPLLSPSLYGGQVMEHEKRLIGDIRKAGQKNVALISGGDTTAIVGEMVKTGTSLLLADSGCDRLKYKEICRKNNVLMRASISPKTVELGDEAGMLEETGQVVEDCRDYYGFIFGCGIVSYDTPPEHVIRLKGILGDMQ